MLDEKPDLHSKQRAILRALDSLAGRANTREIGKREGLDSSTINYHARQLEGEFIEVVGSEDVGAPVPANVYQLTEAGELLAESFDAPMEPAERDAQIGELRDRVERLTDELEEARAAARTARDERDKLAAEVKELREEKAALEEEVEEVRGVVAELIDRLETHGVIDEDR